MFSSYFEIKHNAAHFGPHDHNSDSFLRSGIRHVHVHRGHLLRSSKEQETEEERI